MAGIPASRLKTKITAAETPSPEGMMTLAVIVVVVAGLFVAREVLIPITLAILLSFVLAPLVGRLRRLGLWRVPSVLLAVFVALGVILGLGVVIGTQLAQLGRDAGLYTYTIQQKLDTARGFAAAEMTALSSRLGYNAEPAKPASTKPGVKAGNEPAKPTVVTVQPPEPTPFEMIERLALPVLAPVSSLGIMLVVAVFILMQMEDLRDRMIRLFGSGDLHRTTAAMDDAAARLSRYFLTQLALNASFGIIVGLGLFVIGVPSPALFGIIAALFRFVPYVGAVGAALLPLLLAAGVDPGWTKVAEVAGMFVVIEGITGQVLEPLAYGHSTGLSPVSVVISAIFWAWLWGPVGLILSMPLTLCLVVLGRHVDRLQFIDVLLGDQPALTPAESFYQRILAGDSDEALDQAEILLRDQSLGQYYDEVAVRGLQMAANDSLRGVLTDDQLAHILDAIGEVVLDLADHDGPAQEKPRKALRETRPETGTETAAETVPEPVSAMVPTGTVLCVAGRGALDEAACVMLAQLLGKRGVSVRIASAAAAGRGAVESLDLGDVGVVCVSYLEAAGSMSSLRYLMRRLRARAPGLPTLIGLWQAEPTLLNEDRLKATIGADQYTTSLRDAVEACIAHMPHAVPSVQASSVQIEPMTDSDPPGAVLAPA